MPRRVLEIAGDGRFLHSQRGFVIAEEGRDRVLVGKAPIEDLSSIVLSGFGNSISQELLSRLAKNGVVVVLTGSNQNPAAMLMPVIGNMEQAGRIDAQIALSLPLKKQLWKSTVQSKIKQQHLILKAIGEDKINLKGFANRVKSGDPENLEAQAARRYWPALFGSLFRRNRDLPGVNAALNYGYAILRATVARAVVGSGLLPSLGLHHRDPTNSFRLVDDLMEPFRPFVDLEVFILRDQLDDEDLSKDVRKALVEIQHHDLQIGSQNETVSRAIYSTVQSLIRVHESKDAKALTFPIKGPTYDQIIRLSSDGSSLDSAQ
jgi:CRISPR-associated protein Cas1